MKREYSGTIKNDVNFFIGNEVEKTIAYEKRKLFVVGIHDPHKIEKMYVDNKCEHIFFGANHSLQNHSMEEWEDLIKYFLKQDYLCSLDIPYEYSRNFLDGPLIEYNNFIPQIRIPMPHIQQWPYNTMIKFDDIGYNQTNPGVWCHSLHELMDANKFTCWDRYKDDKEVNDE